MLATKAPRKLSPVNYQGVKTKKVASHPTSTAMVIEAITKLNEKGGSSLQAIKKYIADVYKVDTQKLGIHIRKALIKAVEAGKLTQPKGNGAAGSFKLAVKSKPAKKPAAEKNAGSPTKKPAVKKTAGAKKAAGSTKPRKLASPKKPKAAKSPKKPTGVKKAATPKKAPVKTKAPKVKKSPKGKKTPAAKRVAPLKKAQKKATA